MLNLLTRKKVPGDLAACKAGNAPQEPTASLNVQGPVVSPVHVQGQPQVQGQAMKFKFGNGDQPLPGFTIKRGVGIGGFGDVYFATNDAGKEVALKQIQRNLDVEVRGVRQCMNLKHPNLIALYDIQFDAAEQGWIVMEYVAGMSLREAIEAHPQGLPQPELERWFSQIVAGVAYLHDHGIVHRDLKPANIFEDQGIVKIGDYGLSKFISCSRRGGQTESVGTFHYMAPEIGRGEYGKEIDIYALGIMLYEMATGGVPFDGESSQEIIMKHLTADPDLSRVTSPVREVVARALAKNPATRSSDVREMLQPLGWELDGRYLPIPSSQPSKPSAPRVATQSASSTPPVVGAAPESPRMAGAAAQSYTTQWALRSTDG
jgi:eukaryotic-like serine/threonine-protein kinase